MYVCMYVCIHTLVLIRLCVCLSICHTASSPEQSVGSPNVTDIHSKDCLDIALIGAAVGLTTGSPFYLLLLSSHGIGPLAS